LQAFARAAIGRSVRPVHTGSGHAAAPTPRAGTAANGSVANTAYVAKTVWIDFARIQMFMCLGHSQIAVETSSNTICNTSANVVIESNVEFLPCPCQWVRWLRLTGQNGSVSRRPRQPAILMRSGAAVPRIPNRGRTVSVRDPRSRCYLFEGCGSLAEDDRTANSENTHAVTPGQTCRAPAWMPTSTSPRGPAGSWKLRAS
jgi:hypothetical protein